MKKLFLADCLHAAAQQEHENLFGQILHGVLSGGGHDWIRLIAVPDDAVGRQAEAARWG
jgi:hypothetical protein